MRVFREEIEKNKGWQDNVKQLQGDVDKSADSAALKKSKEIYERMRVGFLDFFALSSLYWVSFVTSLIFSNGLIGFWRS